MNAKRWYQIRIASHPASALTILISLETLTQPTHIPEDASWPFLSVCAEHILPRYPDQSAEAIAKVDKLRRAGAQFCMFSSEAVEWLRQQENLKRHLNRHGDLLGYKRYPPIYEFDQVASSALTATLAPADDPILNELRPQIESRYSKILTESRHVGIVKENVLVVGIYCADRRNTIEHIIGELSAASHYNVEHRWAMIGEQPPSCLVEQATKIQVPEPVPKTSLLNQLLTGVDLNRYEYLLLADDDVVLPQGFLDDFLTAQSALGLALAQPARTRASHIDRPIVAQNPGLLARRTRFVETGPMVSFHRTAASALLPFKSSPSMGWGYGNIWAWALERLGLQMGIIDGVPIDHSIRRSASYYDRHQARLERDALLSTHPHLTYAECFRIRDVATELVWQSSPHNLENSIPGISVVIAPDDSANGVRELLTSLLSQDLNPSEFEVVLIDCTATKSVREYCNEFRSRFPLKYFRIKSPALGNLLNLAVFAARAPLLLFLPPHHVAPEQLLRKHLESHANNSQQPVAVIGRIALASHLKPTPFSRYYLAPHQAAHSSGAATISENAIKAVYHFAGSFSIERNLLMKEDVFDSDLHSGLEFADLVCRLSKRGLRVRNNDEAVTYLNRPVSYNDHLERFESAGRAICKWYQKDGELDIQRFLTASWSGATPTSAETRLVTIREHVKVGESLIESECHPDSVVGEIENLWGWYELGEELSELKGFLTEMKAQQQGKH